MHCVCYSNPVKCVMLCMKSDLKFVAWQCIDALVFHFLRYASMAREGDGAPKALPVIFHQCLLVFAQRYRNDSKLSLMTPQHRSFHTH